MMLTDYIYTAMNRAKYEILDDGIFYGEIPDCQGVWSSAKTLEQCRENLQDALEGWIILGLRLGHQLPILDHINSSCSNALHWNANFEALPQIKGGGASINIISR
jgi:predicted RNase H-like HicB family nuclease